MVPGVRGKEMGLIISLPAKNDTVVADIKSVGRFLSITAIYRNGGSLIVRDQPGFLFRFLSGVLVGWCWSWRARSCVVTNNTKIAGASYGRKLVLTPITRPLWCSCGAVPSGPHSHSRTQANDASTILYLHQREHGARFIIERLKRVAFLLSQQDRTHPFSLARTHCLDPLPAQQMGHVWELVSPAVYSG